ncbi:hypothetical protein ABEB36_003704 [Hypothenemus hampei]|uniref:Palmitoyltransferase n=1 Tax=Hypothenemus hampei TaxID=57062 RepID=A0ABD1F1G2_HYPHA
MKPPPKVFNEVIETFDSSESEHDNEDGNETRAENSDLLFLSCHIRCSYILNLCVAKDGIKAIENSGDLSIIHKNFEANRWCQDKSSQFFRTLNLKNPLNNQDFQYITEHLDCTKPIADLLDILQVENNTFFGILLSSIHSLNNKLRILPQRAVILKNPEFQTVVPELVNETMTTNDDAFFDFEDSSFTPFLNSDLPRIELEIYQYFNDPSKDSANLEKYPLIKKIFCNIKIDDIMCFGPFKRLCHWGPLTAIAIIKLVTGATLHCSGMWWPSATPGGFLNTLCFMSLSAFTLCNLLSAIANGPGYLPLQWMPKDPNKCQFLQKCMVCQGYKAPRAHHCRKCGRCVQKMDHHCPWINNCVGWGNHANFTYFLFFATIGCLQASVILGCSLYRALYRNNYIYYKVQNVPLVHLGVGGMIITVLASGFALGVVIAVGMLLYLQVRSILKNCTGIEDWILTKANHRRNNKNETFIHPYDLGWKENLRQVFTLYGQPVGNGIDFPVRDGCHEFTLTIEQIEQKHEKRTKTKTYKIIKPSSGYWFPIVHGIKVCCNYPCTDEPRLKLDVGDLVQVTRWRKHWIFGEKIQSNLPEEQAALLRQRGWIPKPCAVLIPNDEHSNSQSNKEKND